jgi:hypothetical protein
MTSDLIYMHVKSLLISMSEFTHLIYILTHKEALKSYDQRREKKEDKKKKKKKKKKKRN